MHDVYKRHFDAYRGSGGLTSSTINIPDSKVIRSVRVITDITHASFPDLDVHLRSPAVNDNGLFTDVGNVAQTGAQNIRLEGEAAIPMVFTIPNGVIWRAEPAYNLSWFNGENSLGTWTLDIRDDSSTVATPGTLNSWSLEVCEEPALTGTIVYSQDFEANDGSYTHTGTADEWEYGTPATAAQTTTSPFIAAFSNCASGTKCWKTDLDNTYDISSSQDLTSPNINLTTHSSGPITLSWQQRYQMESISFDRIWVRVTDASNPADTRIVWHSTNATMSESNGSGASLANLPESAGWGVYRADISDFAGQNIKVTFHLESDSSFNWGGWAIDDVTVRAPVIPAVPSMVSGRLTSNGRGVSKVDVTLVEQNGTEHKAVSSSFGYFTFFGILSQQNVTLKARSKTHTFADTPLFLTGDSFTNWTGTPNP